MKQLAIFITLLCISFQACAEATKSKRSPYALLKMETVGVKHYKKGNFDKAYPKLSNAAYQGMKQAQYLLGFMYLKGQHVKQSPVLGTVWLGLAKETKIDEWVKTYNKVYSMLNDSQQNEVDQKLIEYTEKYGIETQNIKCEIRKNSVRAANKDSTICHKVEFGEVQKFEI